MKSILSKGFIALVVLFLLVPSLPTGAKNKQKDPVPCQDVEGEVSYQKDESGKITHKKIKVKNLKKYAKEHDIELHPTSEITLVIPVSDEDESLDGTAAKTDSSAQMIDGPQREVGSNEYYVKNSSYSGETCSSEFLQRNYYDAPGGWMRVSEGVKAEYSVNVGVDAEVISAGVGFSVTGTFEVTGQQDISLSSGQQGSITAYRMNKTYSYEVWEDDAFSDDYIETGYAYKPSGVCFSVHKW
ncbi:hypothetical protein [[Bacillus] enclensis]|uniref:hypothetical protein n=1 Tax=[Bacillus] enclensis TaxID=1402860 RepID=UPI00050995E3|nr:hypothetical protein [[Bacillus] enclensis]MBH9966086.1 hypothetical protein [[Bacillus] enclensis]